MKKLFFLLVLIASFARADVKMTETLTHVTTNTTVHLVTASVHLFSAYVYVSVAGASSNTLTIQTTDTTPRKLAVIDTTSTGGKLTLNFPQSIVMNGIDIISATGTAPTADVWLTYR